MGSKMKGKASPRRKTQLSARNIFAKAKMQKKKAPVAILRLEEEEKHQIDMEANEVCGPNDERMSWGLKYN